MSFYHSTVPTPVPTTISKYNRWSVKFPEWLISRGAKIMKPLNKTEVIRFEAQGHTGIIYCMEDGKLSYLYEAERAFDCFVNHKSWELTSRNKRLTKQQRENVIPKIIARDGQNCVFCGLLVPLDDCSVEHFIPLSEGGPSALSNLVLSHPDCNHLAGNKPVAEKIEMIVQTRRLITSS